MCAKYVCILSIKSCLTLFPSTSSDSEQKPRLKYSENGKGCQIGTRSRRIGLISLKIHGLFGRSEFGCQPISQPPWYLPKNNKTAITLFLVCWESWKLSFSRLLRYSSFSPFIPIFPAITKIVNYIWKLKICNLTQS